MKNEFYAVMVIYNRSVNDSITFKRLVANPSVHLVVCDNSTEENNNEEQVKAFGTYIPMDGNKGLAKAYNSALDRLKGEEGYVCFFDDDTDIPFDFFDEMLKKISDSEADIILPVVNDGVGIMSPCIINGSITKRISSLSELDDINISGINSGMCVNLDVFKVYRYDGEYFLDFIDHAFLRDMKKAGKSVAVAEKVVLNQKFSANDKNVERARKRYKIFKKDYLLFCKKSKSLLNLIMGRLYLLKRWININLLYRIKK